LLAHRRELADARAGAPTATRLYADEAGALRLSAFAPLRGRDGQVVALMAVDAPPQFFAVLDTVRRELLLVGITAIGLIALAGALVLRQVDARLSRLRDVTTRAARGELGAVDEAHAPDPIGALGRDLDRLIASIIASRDYQEAVLGSLDVAVVTCDAAGRVTLANPRAVALLAPDAGDLRGHDIVERLAHEPALRAFAAEVRAAAHATAGAELPLAGGLAGGGRVLAVSASRLQGEAGGFILSLLDVTDMRRAEHRARENERLAALGGMAGGLLHELGNPLAALAMYLDLLRPLATSSEGQDLVARALREDARLREFLEDFRVFAGLAPLRVETVDLAEIVKSAAEPLSWTSDAPPPVGEGRARGDARLLVHAARNLLRNALEAGPGRIVVEIASDADAARIAVADDGPGLSADALERILQPFHTTKPHGTGLGLMIARRVAELHGGRLEALSRPGEGARFTLRWPTAGEKGQDTWRVS
jgi:signal transduction histidine kinase